MARHRGHNVVEKSKDFKGSMIRLFKSLNKWKYTMIVALTLAMISAIFALITPNKLSDFADEIGKGIAPKVEVLENIGLEIGKNISNTDKNKFTTLFIDVDLNDNEKEIVKKVLQELSTLETKEEITIKLLSLPDKVLLYLIEDIEYKNTLITSKDQITFIRLSTKMTENNNLSLIDELPNCIYELVKPSIDMNKIKSIAIFMGTLYLISALFNYIQSFSLTTVSNKFANRLRGSISTKINKLPLKYFDTNEIGDILSRVTNDVDTIAQNLNNSLATLVTSITLFIGSILMMFITNWIMALTAIISSLIGFVLMFLILSKSQKYFIQRQKELGNMNGYIEEIYSGHNVVKAYNGEYKANKEFDGLNNKLYECNWKSQFLSGIMQPLMMFIGNFGYVAVCVVGALLVMNNIITFGVIVAFIIYVRMFSNPLSQIAQAMTSLQSVAAAVDCKLLIACAI